MEDVEIIGMLKSYIKATLAGMGALKGAPCKIKSVVDNADGTQTMTFLWDDDNGDSHESEVLLPVPIWNFTDPQNGQVPVWNATEQKWVNVSVDASPTVLSDRLVKSGGVYAADMNEAITRSALGAKNLIPYPYYNGDSRDTNGITFTANSDGSITISGTATADAYFRLTYTTGDIHIPLIRGKSYIMSATGKADVAMLLRDSSTSNVASARATDATYSCTDSGDYDAILCVDNGADYTTPITIYPMLRLATDIDSGYQPYAKSNKQLTDEQGYVTDAQYTTLQTLFATT